MRGRRPETLTPGNLEAVPLPPAWLDKDGKSEWRRVAPILSTERRVLTLADLATLASYCAAVGQVAGASRIIATEGMTFATDKGPRKHPAVTIRNDAMTQARLLAGELGLTPTSRSRPSMRDESANPEDEDLGL